jgi:hypothetical protein
MSGIASEAAAAGQSFGLRLKSEDGSYLQQYGVRYSATVLQQLVEEAQYGEVSILRTGFTP